MKPNKMITRAFLTGTILIGLQAFSFAQEATTQPGPFGPPFGRGRIFREQFKEFRNNNLNLNSVSQDPPSDEEWNDIATFVKANMPNRWEMLDKIPKDRAKAIQGFRTRLAVRYRQIMRVKDNSPGDGDGDSDLYNILVDQTRKEDDVWGALSDYRQSNADEKKKTILKDKIGLLVKSLLAERENRIAKMEQNLETEKNKLYADKQHMDEIINERIQTLINNPRGIGEIVPRGGGGPRRQDDASPSTQPTDKSPQ